MPETRDAFVWRVFRPVADLASMLTESTPTGELYGTTEARGLVHAALAGRHVLKREAKVVEAHRLPSDQPDQLHDAADVMAIVAAVALIGTGEHGADVLEAVGMDPAEFVSCASTLFYFLEKRMEVKRA